MLSLPALVLAALSTLGGGDSNHLAPDGRPGLGSQTPLNELLSLVRSPRDEDRAFFNGLRSLASEVRLLVGATTEAYRKQGYFAIVDPKAEPTIEALHKAFDELDAQPFSRLLAEPDIARPVARMLLDSRLRARKAALLGWDFELRELENGLAVLFGATDGFVELTQVESNNVAARVDLSASLLRAMRNDLVALKPGDPDPQAERASDEAAAHLIAVATAAEGERVRRAGVDKLLEESRALAQRMESALFTPRLAVQVAPSLEWRSRIFDQTKPLREEVDLWLPDTDAGRAAPIDISRLARFERMRHAAWKSREGLNLDPLDPEFAWGAAHGLDFNEGLIVSRPYYDRFLALHHIRAHDHRTIQNRELDEREREALDAVQRSVLPNGGRPARF